MALTVQQIVSGLRISRSEFGRIFLAAQMDVVVSGADRQPFDAVTHAGNDQQAFTEALNWAEQKQFLDAMVRGIVNDHLEDGSITAELAEEAMANGSTDPAHKAALQAMMDLSRGFDRPEIQRYGMNLGMRWTVKVLADGALKGTGILIGPNLVLTASHV
ncbi:MAG: hypothetical protein JSR64_07255, partial [Nitrospira sp.]|nr:hypothetical protein [Nitrospira sp.]